MVGKKKAVLHVQWRQAHILGNLPPGIPSPGALSEKNLRPPRTEGMELPQLLLGLRGAQGLLVPGVDAGHRLIHQPGVGLNARSQTSGFWEALDMLPLWTHGSR